MKNIYNTNILQFEITKEKGLEKRNGDTWYKQPNDEKLGTFNLNCTNVVIKWAGKTSWY